MKKVSKLIRQSAGFTLLEILLVVGIISILAGIVILAINPTKQLGDTRNAQRRSDVLTLLNAVYQYSIDHNGVLPDEIVDADSCDLDSEIDLEAGGAGIDLYKDLVESEASTTYLVAMPHDPQATSTDDGGTGTGYGVVLTTSGRVTVCAPLAESGAVISVTR